MECLDGRVAVKSGSSSSGGKLHAFLNQGVSSVVLLQGPLGHKLTQLTTTRFQARFIRGAIKCIF